MYILKPEKWFFASDKQITERKISVGIKAYLRRTKIPLS